MTVETADAVVVGAGLNGAATAYFLARAGLRRVVVLDCGMPNDGASGGAVGLLRSHYDNRPETELAARSMPFFRNWSEMIGGDCGYLQTGFFRFIEADELDRMERNVAFQRDYGERVEILTPDDLRRVAPEFVSEGVGAVVYEPESGTASNSKATTTLLAAAAPHGVSVRAFCAARTIVAHNGRIVGIETSQGRIDTPVIVLAAGARSRDLAATCGVDVPLVAKAISVADIVLPDGLRVPGSFLDPVSDSWITPREQRRAIISAPHPGVGQVVDPDNYDRDFPRSHAEEGLAPVRRRLKGLDPAPVSRWWTRVDSYAPDGKPLLGPVESVTGLFLNTAGAGKGHKTAPAIGAALAELITQGRSTTADLAPFNLSRLSRPAGPWSDSEYKKRVIG